MVGYLADFVCQSSRRPTIVVISEDAILYVVFTQSPSSDLLKFAHVNRQMYKIYVRTFLYLNESAS